MFEFDPAKSVANKAKHGLDFSEAQALWESWGYVIEVPFPVERRWQRIAQLDRRFWTTTFTKRGEAIRLISVRRSRQREIEAYVKASGG